MPRVDDATLAALADPDSPIGGRGVKPSQRAAAELVQWRALGPAVLHEVRRARCDCVWGGLRLARLRLRKCQRCQTEDLLGALLRGEEVRDATS